MRDRDRDDGRYAPCPGCSGSGVSAIAARAYVIDYETQLTGVVAEEHYDQWVEAGQTGTNASTDRVRERAGLVQGPTKRSLVSDFLMTRWPGEGAWFGFRDVLLGRRSASAQPRGTPTQAFHAKSQRRPRPRRCDRG